MPESGKSKNTAKRHLCASNPGSSGTPPDERFERITRIAGLLFDAPIALVALAENDRLIFESHRGLAPAEAQLALSFCARAMSGDGMLTVEDTLRDDRFAGNALVAAAPGVRFCAGAPLAAPDGAAIGALCVMDVQPRSFSREASQALCDLVAWAEREIAALRERSAAAHELENGARLSAILESVAEGVITTDLQGVIESLNPAALEIFGYRADELVGRHIKSLAPQREHPRYDNHIRNLQLEKGPIKRLGIEAVGRRKDGSEFPINISYSDLNLGGKRMLTGVVSDITERKAVERMQNEFVASVSHELRTPLTAILGGLKLVNDGLVGNIPPEARIFLDMAYQNSERLTALINNILDIEHIASGNMDFNDAPHQIAPLLKQALEQGRAQAEKLGVQIALQEDAPDAVVYANKGRLLQVIGNLLSNAIKFSPAGEIVTVCLTAGDNMIRVSVSDNGPGIPEEFRSRIFQRFAQADTPKAREDGGTGLGLSICKAIVKKMGGKIGFDSIKGRGATFYFDLPLWHEAAGTGADAGQAELDEESRSRLDALKSDEVIRRLVSLVV